MSWGKVAHAYNLSTWEIEAGRLQVCGQLGYIVSQFVVCLKKQQKNV
jgi:hypothetical protein